MMDNTLTVMLVEDEEDTCTQITGYADSKENINIVKVTNHSEDAYNYTINNLPDAIILDLELHQGGGSGLDFLEKLSTTFGMYKPFILVTTHNTSELIYKQVRALGADFIFQKYSKDYTFKSPIDFLLIMKNTIINNRKVRLMQGSDYIIELEEQLRQNIEKELAPLNFRKRSKGYVYLSEMIFNTITHNLSYSLDDVANKYNKSVPSYEDSIDRGKGHPTLKKFVLYYAKKLLNYREINGLQ